MRKGGLRGSRPAAPRRADCAPVRRRHTGLTARLSGRGYPAGQCRHVRRSRHGRRRSHRLKPIGATLAMCARGTRGDRRRFDQSFSRRIPARAPGTGPRHQKADRVATITTRPGCPEEPATSGRLAGSGWPADPVRAKPTAAWCLPTTRGQDATADGLDPTEPGGPAVQAGNHRFSRRENSPGRGAGVPRARLRTAMR